MRIPLGFTTNVEVNNINDMRDIVEEIKTNVQESGNDLSKALNDFCFSVEIAYQHAHHLDENNWSIVHK